MCIGEVSRLTHICSCCVGPMRNFLHRVHLCRIVSTRLARDMWRKRIKKKMCTHAPGLQLHNHAEIYCIQICYSQYHLRHHQRTYTRRRTHTPQRDHQRTYTHADARTHLPQHQTTFTLTLRWLWLELDFDHSRFWVLLCKYGEGWWWRNGDEFANNDTQWWGWGRRQLMMWRIAEEIEVGGRENEDSTTQSQFGSILPPFIDVGVSEWCFGSCVVWGLPRGG